MFKHVLITKFHLIISDHATQHSCKIERKSEKCEIFIYNYRKLRKLNLKKVIEVHKNFIHNSITFDLKDFVCSSVIVLIVIVFVLESFVVIEIFICCIIFIY